MHPVAFFGTMRAMNARLIFLVLGALVAVGGMKARSHYQSTHWNPTDIVTQQSRRMQQVSGGATVFIGDSNTDGLATSQIATRSENLGIDGDSTRGVLKRLPLYRLGNNTYIVAIGSNDCLSGESDGFAERYSNILDLLPDSSPVVASSIPPVKLSASSRTRRCGSLIVEMNQSIKSACEKRANCRFVNMTPLFAQSEEITVADGVHLSPKGYEIWSKALRDTIGAN